MPELINLRPAVGRFAVAMEKTLRNNDERKGTTGWKKVSHEKHEARIDANLSELKEAIRSGNSDEVKERCVDIGNLAMMRWDNEITKDKIR